MGQLSGPRRCAAAPAAPIEPRFLLVGHIVTARPALCRAELLAAAWAAQPALWAGSAAGLELAEALTVLEQRGAGKGTGDGTADGRTAGFSRPVVCGSLYLAADMLRLARGGAK